MFEELLKQWASDQDFETWSQDHAAVLSNLSRWLYLHAAEKVRELDVIACAAPDCEKNAIYTFGLCSEHAHPHLK